MTLGERLRYIRRSRQITLREVYEATGINFSNLAQIERDEHGCNAETIKLLSNFYNVPMDFLLGATDDMTPVKKTEYTTGYDLLDIAIHDASKDLSKDEKLQVLDFINFMKTKKERNNEQ